MTAKEPSMSDSTAPSSNTSDGQVAADLRAAADVLERDGWTQYDFHDTFNGSKNVCSCVQGAIAVAVAGDPWAVPMGADTDYTRWAAANQQLAEYLDVPATDEWNDADDREQEQVIAALRAAADRAEAQS